MKNVAWGVALFLAAARGVAQDGAAADTALLAAIRSGMRAIESAWRGVAVDCDVAVERDGGGASEQACVRFAASAGRVEFRIDGVDLDSAFAGLGHAVRRTRLFLPGGIVETEDLPDGAVVREQRSFRDPTALVSDLGPAEFTWAFCGSMRSAILAARAPEVGAIVGDPPRRRVDVRAVDSARTQSIVFSCREDWGWLAERAVMSVRDGATWRESRVVDVAAVHRTRFGFFPASAQLRAERPPLDGRGAHPPLRARYRFGVPTIDGVEVAEGLSRAAAASRPGVRDLILTAQSILAREPIAGRGPALDRLVLTARAAESPAWGRPGPGLRGVAFGALAAAGASALCAARFRCRAGRIVPVALLVLGLLAAAVAVADLAGPPQGDVVVGLDRVPCDVPPRARTLCGVDALAIALGVSGRAADYDLLVRLVRPGAQGTTLEALRVAAECLGAPARVVNPRGLSEPGRALVAHVAPGHFVVVAPGADGGVVVVDPSSGVYRGGFDAVRGRLGRLGLSL